MQTWWKAKGEVAHEEVIVTSSLGHVLNTVLKKQGVDIKIHNIDSNSPAINTSFVKLIPVLLREVVTEPYSDVWGHGLWRCWTEL